MRVPVITLVIASMVLVSCGGFRDSRVNPRNWFGSSTSQEVETITNEDGEVVKVNPLIGERKQSRLTAANKQRSGGGARLRDLAKRGEGPYEGTLVAQVTSLEVRQTSSGALVFVTGLSSRQGAFDVRLIPTNDGQPIDGVLTYELRALQPVTTAQGPERTRRIQAAEALDVETLSQVRTVRVVSRQTVRTTRR